jgi:ATP-dependent Zn protease
MNYKTPFLVCCLLFTFNSNADFFDFIRSMNEFNAQNRAAFLSAYTDSASKKKSATQDEGKGQALSDFQGMVPAQFNDILQVLRGDEFYTGLTLPKGILLVGAPGTGKTSMARALANEANVPFVACSASEFVCLYVGQGAANVRKIFAQAREKIKESPLGYVILFIDEIDALGNRDNLFDADSETRRTINELLNQMDGFDKDEKIIVIAATNRMDLVDSALRRPGRFDYVITISLPDEQQRLAILSHYLFHPKYDRTVEPSIRLEHIAQKTVGFTGAELESIIKQAVVRAARNRRKAISQLDLDTVCNELCATRSLRN